MTGETELQKALNRGMRPGGDLSHELFELGEYEIEESGDALAVCKALEDYVGSLDIEEPKSSPLHPLASLFQDVASDAAYAHFSERGIPLLIRVFDRKLADPGSEASDLLFLLKIFVLYKSEEGVMRISQAARRPLEPDSFIWAIIFENIEEDHPHRFLVCDQLRNPLPTGFAAVTYLDFVNRLAQAGELTIHPFDTPEGTHLLEQWLRTSDPEKYSYAQSAAMALPSISAPDRDRMMALALEHTDESVQLEGAWVSAKLGSEGGVKLLSRFCLDLAHSAQATGYLLELEREDAIPEKAQDPDFQAKAEICAWLSHPQEFGEAPDELELYDTREMFWPPTDDERQVWLYKYRYKGENEDDEDERGVGMVGSITFALFGETTDDLSADDIYALHCCWELEVNDDPRGPEERTVEAGRKILAEYC